MDTTTISAPRRLAQRAMGLTFGLALPTGLLSLLLGLDPIKRRINGRLWCSDADEIEFDVIVESRSKGVGYSDVLECRKDGMVIRTLGDLRMMPTTIAVAFAMSLLLMALLVGGLVTYSKLRRHHRAS